MCDILDATGSIKQGEPRQMIELCVFALFLREENIFVGRANDIGIKISSKFGTEVCDREGCQHPSQIE